MVVPWTIAIGPLQLVANNELPRDFWNKYPNFNDYWEVFSDDNMETILFSCCIASPQLEDITVRMFIETLVENNAN